MLKTIVVATAMTVALSVSASAAGKIKYCTHESMTKMNEMISTNLKGDAKKMAMARMHLAEMEMNTHDMQMCESDLSILHSQLR